MRNALAVGSQKPQKGRSTVKTRLAQIPVDRAGASAAEFALVLPLLLIFVFGILQYGLLLFTFNNMNNAAREAARALAVSEVNEAEAETLASGMLVQWPDDWQVTAEDKGTTGTDYVRVEITVSGGEASILEFLPMPALMAAEVFMRKE